MLFNSFHFLVFFPIVVILYFSIPHRWRWLLLLIASYYFYMCWKVEYIFLIVGSTLIDYYAGRQMGKIPERSKRKKYLIISLIVNLGLLFGFKYFNFVNDSVRDAFNYFNIFYGVPAFNVLLPVGISFYTFQTLSYTIDIYNGRSKPEPHIGKFALYVSFFPQLVSGPIERSYTLLPQFHKDNRFDQNNVTSGLKLMMWGFIKKVVIADRLGIYVFKVFSQPHLYEGFPVIFASIFLLVQVYCDLSGYSDIAIGTARVMGYKLMRNFNRPFIARSIADFWARWHISLTTWFRDYLYIPLGGNRVPKWRWHYNIFITFLLSGLWHGASWSFVIWGALHGLFQMVEKATKKYRESFAEFIGLVRAPGLKDYINIVITFCLICFATIFFGARSLDDAYILILKLGTFSDSGIIDNFINVMKNKEVLLCIIFIIFLLVIEYIHEKYSIVRIIGRKPLIIRWAVYLGAVIFIIVFGVFTNVEFIYFQF